MVTASSSDAIAARAPGQLTWLSLAIFFGMTLWFSATAANAAIVAGLHLTGATTAWRTWRVARHRLPSATLKGSPYAGPGPLEQIDTISNITVPYKI
jgi:hypothetical protein